MCCFLLSPLFSHNFCIVFQAQTYIPSSNFHHLKLSLTPYFFLIRFTVFPWQIVVLLFFFSSSILCTFAISSSVATSCFAASSTLSPSSVNSYNLSPLIDSFQIDMLSFSHSGSFISILFHTCTSFSFLDNSP